VAAQADWIIDLGPGAGEAGGRIVASGTPQAVAAHSRSRTATYLAPLVGGAHPAIGVAALA
jgi:excinuclease ABC subunit A